MSHYSTLKGLGRAIAYFPQLGLYLGSPLAGIFLSQLVYWHDKTDHELGVYKTSEEWLKETGMTYSQQKTARKLLKDLGILFETEKRLEHKLYFKLDVEAFDQWFENCIYSEENGEQQIVNPRTRNPAFGEEQNLYSGEKKSCIRGDRNPSSVYTKITTENTTEITANNSYVPPPEKPSPKPKIFDASSMDLSQYPNVDRDVWLGFVEMRKTIKKPLTERAAKIILKKLRDDFKDQANVILDQSTVNNYQDIYPLKSPTGRQPNHYGQQPYQKRFGLDEPAPMRDVGDYP
ncbi:hypothetical protein NDN13_05365 [Acinetobacter sp. C32I]|uniref:hypothetical protein n=1 Tax=Acinetobacter sp. C32I TaxID=2950074 RepID=UPI0020374AFC|nr:hypothetical protein [Acinetobacter sp. C32I]USA54623.1 hypothetical protein NDN13_05365 [Acinetobacter sp. C32I]